MKEKINIVLLFFLFAVVFYSFLDKKNDNSDLDLWKKDISAKFAGFILKDSLNSVAETNFRDSISLIIEKRDQKIDSLSQIITNNIKYEKRLEADISRIDDLLGELPNF